MLLDYKRTIEAYLNTDGYDAIDDLFAKVIERERESKAERVPFHFIFNLSSLSVQHIFQSIYI